MPSKELLPIQSYPGLRRLAPATRIRRPASLASEVFRRFVLTPSTHQLSCGGVPSAIGGRAEIPLVS